VVVVTCIDDSAAEGSPPCPDEHLRPGRRGNERFAQDPLEPEASMGLPPRPADSLLQGSSDRVVIDDECRLRAPDVVGDPYAQITDPD
jgi:hypothetical protein